jgi:uncharacterized membrane-anchored protein
MLQCNNGFISQRFISVPTHSQCSDIEHLLSYSHYRLMRKVVVESQTQNTVPSQFHIESHVSNTTNKTIRLETNRKHKPDSESEIRIGTHSNAYSLSNPDNRSSISQHWLRVETEINLWYKPIIALTLL